MATRKTGRVFVMTYEVFALDVWGNAQDGFTVNDRFRAGSIEVEVDEIEISPGRTHITPTNKDIVETLIDDGYLKQHVSASMIEFNGVSDETLYLESTSDGEPLFQLEWVSTVENMNP